MIELIKNLSLYSYFLGVCTALLAVVVVKIFSSFSSNDENDEDERNIKMTIKGNFDGHEIDIRITNDNGE